jgi:superfamily II DNA helicase RecQ
MSPELAVSDKLRTVLTAVAFKPQLALVAVDEAHLVSQWGKHFRTDYARLGTIRNFLGRDIPWFACSATLAESTLQDVIQGIGFDADIKLLRTSINRPELLLRVGFIPKGTRQKFTALRYTFDPDPSSTNMSPVEPSHITKSVVFVDSKTELWKAYGLLLTYLQKHERYQYSRGQAQRVLRTFTRDTHDDDKDGIIKEFQKLATDSSVRVIFATEALGMGADLPDIKRVIQYGVPKSLDIAVLWQRGGRACRDGQPGDIIRLMEDWMKGDCAPPPSTGQASVSEDLANLLQDPEDDNDDNDASCQKKPSNLTLSQRRGRLPNIWYQLANNQGCIRTRILDYFAEPAEFRHETQKDRCCSNCNPSYHLDDLDSSRYYLYQEQGYTFGKPQQAIAHDIHQWAETQYQAVYQDERNRFRPNAHCFLSTGQQKQLATYPFEILTQEELPDILGPWPHLDTHGDELMKVRKASRANHLPKKKQASAGKYSQSQLEITNSQMGEILSPHSAMQFASQPVSQQSTLPMSFTRTIGASNSMISCTGSSANETPSRPASQSDPFGFLTPSQATLYTPLPDLSMSTQTVSTNASPGPATPTPPVVSNMKRKRQPLGDISGNVPRKRTRQVRK